MATLDETLRSFAFKSRENGALSLRVAAWLVSKGYVCAVQETDDGVVTITYAMEGDNGRIWPAIHVDAGRVKFPVGTDMELMFAFMHA